MDKKHSKPDLKEVILISSSSSENEDRQKLLEDNNSSTKNCEAKNTLVSNGAKQNGERKVGETSKQLFDRFISRCTPFLKTKKGFDVEKLVSFANGKFVHASPSFTDSKLFKDSLTSSIEQLDDGNNSAFVFVQEVCFLLQNNAKKKKLHKLKPSDEPVPSKRTKFSSENGSQKLKVEKNEKNKLDTSFSESFHCESSTKTESFDKVPKRAVIQHMSDSIKPKPCIDDTGIITLESDDSQTNNGNVSKEPSPDEPCCSTSQQPTTSFVQEPKPDTGATSSRKDKSKLEKKIGKCEKYLKLLHSEIRKLQSRELTLDEMECNNSTYIQESKLKLKVIKVHERLCALQKIKLSHIFTEKLEVTACRYVEINKKVQNYVNKTKDTPDFCAVKYLIKEASKESKLNLRKQELNEIARDVFRNVHSLFQRRRVHGLLTCPSSHLMETAAEDPAETDPDLLKKLDENYKVGQERMKCELQKHVDIQNMKMPSTQENNSANNAESDDDGDNPLIQDLSSGEDDNSESEDNSNSN